MNEINKQRTKKKLQAYSDIEGTYGKIPPQSIDLEEAVLGASLIDEEGLESVINILKEEHFYKDAHRRIWAAIRQLYIEKKPVDILTVTHHLRKTEELEIIGGAYYISSLTNRVSSSANIEYHARIILQNSMRREVIRISNEYNSKAYSEETDVFQLIIDAETDLSKVIEETAKRETIPIREAVRDAMKNIDEIERKRAQGLTIGVPTGFPNLDESIGGFHNSDLIIIAARPGMGKTALLLTLIRNITKRFRIPAAVFSLEMSCLQLTNRSISMEAGVDSIKFRTGGFTSEEIKRVQAATATLAGCPMFIDDTPAITLMELRAKARRLKSKHNIGLIAVDYLQLMRNDEVNKNGNREQEISSISQGLKALAKELSVPVIALAQLSRALESRSNKRPMLSDLRESGAIEQDADGVIFIYRPDYYGITTDEEGNDISGITELNIAKYRHGSLDTIHLKFINELTLFTDDLYGTSYQKNFEPAF